MEYIDSEKHFSFRHYEYTPRGMAKVRLYASAGGSSVDVSARRVPTGLTAWLAIIAPTLFQFITESKTGVVSYNPQQAMRQLGYDQSAIQLTGEMGCSDSKTAESQFVGEGSTLCPSSKEFSGLTE